VTESRDFGLHAARFRDGVLVNRLEGPAAATVEVDRGLVVVRGDEPQAVAARTASDALHRVE